MCSPAAPVQHKAPKRILIIRLSALGDVVLSSGLIPALKARWPDAQVSWLVEPPAAPLLVHNTRLEELILFPKTHWRALWRAGERRQVLQEVRRWRRSLRDRQFDLVVDPQGLFKSGLCGWMSGATRRVSLNPREGNQLLGHEAVRTGVPVDPVIGHEYRALARYLGAQEVDFQLDLALGAEASQTATHTLQKAGVTGPFVVLAPFTTRPQKHWFEDRWAALAAGLLAQGLQPVLLGGPGDAAAAQRLVAHDQGIVNLVGQLKLDASAALIAQATQLVGVDTGLTHMGFALNIPTLAIFGSTMPYLHAGSPTGRVLYAALPCSPCHRKPTCGGRFDCMAQWQVQDVLNAAAELRQAAGLPPGQAAVA